MAHFRIHSVRGVRGFGELEPYSPPLYEPHLHMMQQQPMLQPVMPPSVFSRNLRPKRPYKKPGRAVRCKTKLIKLPNSTRKMKRKLCWDAHGRLTSNTPVGRGGKSSKKTKRCKGGQAVCRKWGCKKKKRRS